MKIVRTTAAVTTIALTILPYTAQARAECHPSNFEIKQLELREIVIGRWASVVGEVVSHCTTPAAAILRVTLRTPDGRILAVVSGFSVGDLANIEPGESAPFEQAMSGAFDGLAVRDVKIEGKIVGVTRWDARWDAARPGKEKGDQP
jgi:hypothetical protein